MIPRLLEPEVMDTAQEAADYDAMDHRDVNRRFVDDLLAAMHDVPAPWTVLDVGTGTAQIPIELVRHPAFAGSIVGIDLAQEMLALAHENIDRAGASDRIHVQLADAKSLCDVEPAFDVVMSNSIVHHIPEPLDVLREMARLLRPGGLLFVRDLLRPDSERIVEELVMTYSGEEPPRPQQLFRQSLHAALTVAEIQELADQLSIPRSAITQSSDRHWTLIWRSSEGTSLSVERLRRGTDV